MRLEEIVERREARSHAFRLAQPLFMRVSRSTAAWALTGSALLAIVASHLLPSTTGYGPVFLMIFAFGAWLVSSQFALTLGLFVVIVQFLNGHGIFQHDGTITTAVELTVRLACALAVVFMLSIAREGLEVEWRYARSDPLTGALNRKALFEAVKAETKRDGISLLVFADVNGLKRVNDRLGHEAGDAALRDFADRVQKAIRKGDLFARIGGDEFVIYMNVRDPSAAELVAQRLHQVLNVDARHDDARLQCSLGVLVLPVGSESIDDELRQADALMYKAKAEGLGLVISSSIKGDVTELAGITPTLGPDGQRRAVVRPKSRYADTPAG